jgi:glycosyltransferase involved in cell wall biosynthesis
MKVSVIIPTYNAREALSQSLHYLSKQVLRTGLTLEVIVIDDGSIEASTEVIDHFSREGSIASLEYIYRPRDEYSNRSRTRNLGIAKSTGDVLVFLDSGVLVPPVFIEKVAEKYTPIRDVVLAHYLLGLFTKDDPGILETIKGLTPENMSDTAQELFTLNEWLDVREGLFDLVDDDLDRLSAPWTMGYSAAITAPRHLTLKIGGFDEDFYGWGSEDTDFCYRLYLEGASFAAEREAFALHVPHPVSSWEEKKVTNFANRKKLHRKKYLLETELYPYYPGTYYNQMLARFDNMVIKDVIPWKYSSSLLSKLNEEYLSQAQTSLFIGSDSTDLVRELRTTHLFSHNKPTFRKFQNMFPQRSVSYLLGCDTPYSDDFFDIVVVSDFYRLLNPLLQEEFIKELDRISKRIIFIYTEEYVSVLKRIDQCPWADESELNSAAGRAGLALTQQDIIDGHRMLALGK